MVKQDARSEHLCDGVARSIFFAHPRPQQRRQLRPLAQPDLAGHPDRIERTAEEGIIERCAQQGQGLREREGPSLLPSPNVLALQHRDDGPDVCGGLPTGDGSSPGSPTHHLDVRRDGPSGDQRSLQRLRHAVSCVREPVVVAAAALIADEEADLRRRQRQRRRGRRTCSAQVTEAGHARLQLSRGGHEQADRVAEGAQGTASEGEGRGGRSGRDRTCAAIGRGRRNGFARTCSRRGRRRRCQRSRRCERRR